MYPNIKMGVTILNIICTIIEIVQNHNKKYLVKLLRYENFEYNFKKALALLQCQAMALKLALKPICMKPYLTF